jgi:hypothetical protein
MEETRLKEEFLDLVNQNKGILYIYNQQFSYHCPLHALALPDEVLEKVYRSNAVKIFAPAKAD